MSDTDIFEFIPLEFLEDETSDDEIAEADYRASYGEAYEFDFETGDFVESGGSVALLSEGDGILQSVEKLLRTRRYSFLAYDHDYGSDLYDTLEEGADAAYLEGLLEDVIADDLTMSPWVASITTITAELDDPETPTSLDVSAAFVDTFGAARSLSTTLSV